MSSLMDIAVMKSTVTVGKVEVEVQGVSVGTIARLMGRFPVMRSLLSGEDVDIPSIMAMGDQVVAAIIAAGCGLPNNEDAEVKARSLPIGTQIDLLSAILKETMPGGISPLVAKISELTSAFNLSAVEANLPVANGAASQENSRPQLNA
jgi:hypothetical protein